VSYHSLLSLDKKSPPRGYPQLTLCIAPPRVSLLRRDPLVLHVVRRMMPRRTMTLKMRLRNRRHQVTVPRSCEIDELKVAALAAFQAADPAAEQHEDLRLVFNGAVLDAAKGLPLVECGVNDGAVILAVPCADRRREIAMRAKVMGAPATTVKLLASARVRDVKRMVVTQLPADIVARYPQLPRWQVFLSRGGCDTEGAQRLGDDETLALHRLADSRSVLFLVPPAGMVALDVALGPVRVRLPDQKERLIGLDGCYKEQLAQCRKELQAQLRREAEREKAAAEREAKRMKRLQQKKLRAQQKKQRQQNKQVEQQPPPPPQQQQLKQRAVGKENAQAKPRARGLARGFLAPAAGARSAPSTPTTSPEPVRPKPLGDAHANAGKGVAPPPTWQQRQIQQQKQRRQQQQQQQRQQQEQQEKKDARQLSTVECAAIFLREAYRRRMGACEVGAFLKSRGLTDAEQRQAFALAASCESGQPAAGNQR
jgi:hypothetical protein